MNNKLLYIKEATIEELLSGSSSFGNNIDLIIEVYTWLFDAACGSCPSKFIGYINRIKTYQMETKCDYKLKGNFQVTVSALGGKTMSNHNITNVMAEAFLSTNPVNRAALFSKYPENYLELLESKNKPVEVVEEAKPVVIKKRKTKKKS
tara:strand:- start:574 stop:1020 length:447 start_codon:yes stop_codon:yes gene_type:complete